MKAYFCNLPSAISNLQSGCCNAVPWRLTADFQIFWDPDNAPHCPCQGDKEKACPPERAASRAAAHCVRSKPVCLASKNSRSTTSHTSSTSCSPSRCAAAASVCTIEQSDSLIQIQVNRAEVHGWMQNVQDTANQASNTSCSLPTAPPPPSLQPCILQQVLRQQAASAFHVSWTPRGAKGSRCSLSSNSIRLTRASGKASTAAWHA